MRVRSATHGVALIGAFSSLPNFSKVRCEASDSSELFPSVATYSITQLNIAQRRRLSSNVSECLPGSGDGAIEGRVAVSASLKLRSTWHTSPLVGLRLLSASFEMSTHSEPEASKKQVERSMAKCDYCRGKKIKVRPNCQVSILCWPY